jgi:hypothetical protein
VDLHPCSPGTPLFRGNENITFYKRALSKQIRLQDKSNTYIWKQKSAPEIMALTLTRTRYATVH